MSPTADIPNSSVRDLIVSDEPTVGPGVSLSAGIRALECSRCGTVIVADAEGIFCGTFDFTCGLSSRLPRYAELLPNPRVLSFRPDRKLIEAPGGDPPICDFVDPKPITVGETVTLTELTALFVRHRIDAIPVLRGKRSVGLVARSTLIEHLLLDQDRSTR